MEKNPHHSLNKSTMPDLIQVSEEIPTKFRHKLDAHIYVKSKLIMENFF